MYLSKICLGLLVLFAVSCSNAPERPEPVLEQNNAPSVTTTQTTPPTTTPEPAQNTQGVWHYICPDGHDGGAGSAQPCAQCGKTLVHNKGYHANQTTPTVTSSPTITTGDGESQISSTTLPQIQKPPEPAQNTKGVWHYICPDGHEGGAGSAAPCAQCGKTLVHNRAYHQ